MIGTMDLEHDGVVETRFFEGEDPADLMVKNGASSVCMNAGYCTNYGATKCGAHITLTCDQDAATILKACRIALRVAKEMALEGINEMCAQGGNP